MLPPKQSPVWREFATGKRSLNSSKLAINLMAKSVQVSYQRDPSPANVEVLADRVREFFAQYEKGFADEFSRMLR
jgi:hypothetical protein